MDSIINSKTEKQTIYEIFRACRLCGAGGGYKMPIMQSILNLDSNEVELKQKIKECVQIEVHQDDKMPPLICELCVDKVNDFYEFLELCRGNNKTTRMRLGLPPQGPRHGASGPDDCILGVTEPLYTNESNSFSQGNNKIVPKGGIRVKKESELRVKVEAMNMDHVRNMKSKFKGKPSKRPPSPPSTRASRSGAKDDAPLSKLKGSPKSSKGILKNEVKLLLQDLPRPKRRHDSDHKTEIPNKRVKIQPPIISTRSRPADRPADRSASRPAVHPASRSADRPSSRPVDRPSSRLADRPASGPADRPASRPADRPTARPSRPAPRPVQKRAPTPPPTFPCKICAGQFKTPAAVTNHLRVHQVLYTKPDCACNACGLWFKSPEEASLHHRRHGMYRCQHCTSRYSNYDKYLKHFESKPCEPFVGEPDVKCDLCWRTFATEPLLDDHKCAGEDGRPGGKCNKCKRTYSLLKNLKKHESLCGARRKAEFKVSPELMAKVRPFQVRVARCDPLLVNTTQDHYDVTDVAPEYGLDEKCEYPYISPRSPRIKLEPYLSAYDTMVNITDDSLDFDYVHWDSESESETEDGSQSKEIPTLTNLSLKIIFSHRFLGKVPRKRRKLKAELEKENLFDSTMNNTDIDFAKGINDIIDNLVDDNDKAHSDIANTSELMKNKTLNQTEDSDLFPTNKSNEKSDINDDLDSIFDGNNAGVKDTKDSNIRDAKDDENSGFDKESVDQNDSKNDKATAEKNDLNCDNKLSNESIDKCDDNRAYDESSSNKPPEEKENDAKVNDEKNEGVSDTIDCSNKINDSMEKDSSAVSDNMKDNESTRKKSEEKLEVTDSTTVDDENSTDTKAEKEKCLSDFTQDSNITKDKDLKQIREEKEENVMEGEKEDSAVDIAETGESKKALNDSNEKMDINDSYVGEKLNNVENVLEEAMDVDSNNLDNSDNNIASKIIKDDNTQETKIDAQHTVVDDKLVLNKTEEHKTTHKEEIRNLESITSLNEQIKYKADEGNLNNEVNKEKGNEESTVETVHKNSEKSFITEQFNFNNDENNSEFQNFNSKHESSKTYKIDTSEQANTKTDLNGQTEKEKLKSLSDIEDKNLLDAIDAQLEAGEKNVEKGKTDNVVSKDLGKSKGASMDLDSISDTEFDFEP